MSAGFISTASSDGTRCIHQRRLNSSSDEENHHLTLFRSERQPCETLASITRVGDLSCARCGSGRRARRSIETSTLLNISGIRQTQAVLI